MTEPQYNATYFIETYCPDISDEGREFLKDILKNYWEGGRKFERLVENDDEKS